MLDDKSAIMRKVKKTLILLLLFLLPTILLFLVLSIKNTRGPYYIGHIYDPDYVYLLGSLNAADFKPSKMTFHPGIPVQMIGGLILRIPSLTHAYSNLQEDVLKKPEYYLNRLNYFVIAINVILLISVGIVIYFLTGDVFASLIIQMTPFLSDSILFCLTRYNPEPFLLFSSLLLIFVIVIKSLKIKGDNWRFILLFAIIAGFGLAVKVTFFPLLIIPIFIFKKLSSILKYISLTIITFFVFFIPYNERIFTSLGWWWNLITHKGIYGKGSSGFIDTRIILPNIEKLFLREPIFIYIFIFLIAFIILNLAISGLRKIACGSLMFKILIVVAAIDIIGLVMVSKHFGVPYLIPVYSLSGLAILFIYLYLKALSIKFKFNFKIVKLSFIFFMIGFFIYFNLPSTKYFSIRRSEKLNTYRKVLNEYNGYNKISYYGSTSKLYALYFGNHWIGNDHTNVLNSIYGSEVYFVDFKRKSFFSWDGRISPGWLSQNHKKTIMYGPPITETRRKLNISEIIQKILTENNLILINTMPNNKYETIFKFETLKPDAKTN